MKNWEVVKKKISEMSKDEFVEFISKVGASDIQEIGNMCDIKDACYGIDLCCYDDWKCEDCLKLLLNKEYQPPKQEKWIVHRTLRTKNKEIYIGIKNMEFTQYWLHTFKGNVPITYEKGSAFKHDFYNAVILRDELNKTRVGKQYLWVISRVEE